MALLDIDLSNFEIMQSNVVSDVPTTGTPHSWASTLPRSPQDVRSEDNLASPLIESPQVVSSGASPFKSPQVVRNGDRPYAVRAPRTHGGKDVAVCYVTGHSTAQKDVQH